MDIPDDIFTEPEDVDPETLANLGPLARLAGIWEGMRGHDVNPKADGPEQRDYYERIEMQPELFDNFDWGGCGCFVAPIETEGGAS